MRVIKKDFWESEEIGALSLSARLLLIALWTYVDDNGVRTDAPTSIAAEFFRVDLARDPNGTVARIKTDLDELWRAGWITRYSVGGTAYLEISQWSFWQNPQKPSKSRYPRSTHPEAQVKQGFQETLWRPSGDTTGAEPETETETETEYHRVATYARANTDHPNPTTEPTSHDERRRPATPDEIAPSHRCTGIG
jgi:hypothetical protein